MNGFLKLTAYQQSDIEQKYEEHIAMTGLLSWLKGMYVVLIPSVEMAFFLDVSHTLLVSFTRFKEL